MVDIYSRYIVGVHVHTRESGLLAVEFMSEVSDVHGIPNVVHADRGTSMTSKPVASLLADLEVTRSHSRPKVSNYNPYSEWLFKTLKYGPAFPGRFGSVHHARQFMDSFVTCGGTSRLRGNNHEHRHTGIGLHTPADVHFGLATQKATERSTVLAGARCDHPERFGTSGRGPKILDLPAEAWIKQTHHQRRHRTCGRSGRRVTPVGLNRLDKFRSADASPARDLAWEASYHCRVGIESVFADLKQNRLHVHRGYFRGFGTSRYTLLAGFTLAALNLLNLHDWSSKRERLDPWGRYLGEPEPGTHHTDDCVASSPDVTRSPQSPPDPADSVTAPVAKSTDFAVRPRPYCGNNHS